MPKATIYVYEQNGEIQAFIGLMEGFVAGIFVSSEFQSKGIGKLLLDYSKDRHNELSLCVYKKNIRAIHFYLRESITIFTEQVDKNTGYTSRLEKIGILWYSKYRILKKFKFFCTYTSIIKFFSKKFRKILQKGKEEATWFVTCIRIL